VSWIGRGVALLLLALATFGCGLPSEAGRSSGAAPSPITTRPSRSTPATNAFSPSEAGPTPSELASTLPAGFPVMPEADPSRLPDDASVVARWTVPVVGSAAYDFYMKQLPEADFTIVGTYPSERAALIRFRDPRGRIWQLLAELLGDRTRVTVQTDRP
jgi:hypothetical protein